MGKLEQPYLRLVAALLKSPDRAYLEELGVKGALVQIELEIVYSLSDLSAFHVSFRFAIAQVG